MPIISVMVRTAITSIIAGWIRFWVSGPRQLRTRTEVPHISIGAPRSEESTAAIRSVTTPPLQGLRTEGMRFPSHTSDYH